MGYIAGSLYKSVTKNLSNKLKLLKSFPCRQFNSCQTIFWSEIVSFKELRAVTLELADGVNMGYLQDVSHGVLVQADFASIHVGQHQVEHLLTKILNADLIH